MRTESRTTRRISWRGRCRRYNRPIMKTPLALVFLTPLLPAAPLTFSEHIAPIVYKRCAGCHRPGEAGPFPLTNYQEVSKRAKLIASVTAARYMPPWHAESAGVTYRDERRLS